MRNRFLVCFFLWFGWPLAWAAGGAGVESIGPLVDPSVSEAVKKSLEPRGYRLTLDDGSVACEIWLRASVPASAGKEAPGAAYPQLSESTLLGVLALPQIATDYRGHAIKPGTYTLRYELLPNDGNHLGAAPNRDFVLMVSAASDADPNAQFKFEEVVALSRKVTGLKHPAPLSLVPAEGGNPPSVSKNDEDHWIFTTRLKLATGEEIPFAMVVKGLAQQ
jgi:hypothetical protein